MAMPTKKGISNALTRSGGKRSAKGTSSLTTAQSRRTTKSGTRGKSAENKLRRKPK